MANPRITIETYLEKIRQGDIQTIHKQLKSITGQVEGMTSGVAARNAMINQSVETLSKANKTYGRGMVQTALRTKVATNQLNSFREAVFAGKTIMLDMVSVTGMANAALNILISRFGTMIVVFGLYRKIVQWKQAMNEAALAMDTAEIKIRSLIIPTTDLDTAMTSIMGTLIRFATEVGGTIEQLSDTYYFLASSGLDSARAAAIFDDAQKLVLVTAKDLNATQTENKQILETFAGIYKNFSKTLVGFNSEQEKASYIADLIFYAYKRNQILLPELAVGFTYAAAQAKIMNISLAEIIITLAKANSVMIKGSKAGTSYANALSDIVKNQKALREKFGITLDLDKEGGFSFIKEVLVPMNEQLEKSANRVQFLSDLMEVFNKRGARITAALLPQTRELVKEYDGMTKAQGERSRALSDVVGSLKNQLQIQDNIRTVSNDMWSRAVTGGIKRAEIIKIQNDLWRTQIKQVAAIAYSLSIITSGVIAFAGGAYVIFNIIYNILQMLGNIGDLLQSFWQAGALSLFAKRMKGDWDDMGRAMWNVAQINEKMRVGMDELWQISIHGFATTTELAKAADEITKGRISFSERQLELEKLINKTREEAIKFLSREKVYYDELGNVLQVEEQTVEGLSEAFDIYREQLIGTDKALSTLVQTADAWAHAAAEATTVKTPIDEKEIAEAKARAEEYALASTNTLNDIFAAAARNEFFQEFKLQWEGVAMSLPQSLEQANTRINKQIAVLTAEWDTALGDITAKGAAKNKEIEEINKRFTAAIYNIAIDGKEDEARILAFFSNKELKALRNQSDLLIRELKNRYDTFATLRSGTTLAELNAQDLPTVLFEDIVFDPDQFAGARAEMQVELDKILAIIDKQINSGVEQIVSKRGAAYASIGPKFRQSILAEYEKLFKSVADIGEKALAKKERKAFDDFIKAATKIYALTEDSAQSLARLIAKRDAGDELLPDELKQLKEFEDAIGGRQEAYNLFIKKVRELRRESEKLERFFASLGIDITKGKIGIKSEELDESIDAIRKYRVEIETELGIIADSFANTGDIIVDITDIIVDQNNRAAQNMAATASEVLNMTSRLMDIYLTYRQTVSSLQAQGLSHLLGLNQMGAVLAGVSIVAGAISAIKGIFSRAEEDKNALQQEFLPSDSAARVSADYGQARVINQRISLTPVFQFLDPSQLNEAQQRNLAVAIYDNLLELEKEAG